MREPGPRAARIMAALGSCFNFLALNLVLVAVSLPLVTLPIAVTAAMGALDRWRIDGEDRTVREFFISLRSLPLKRTTLAVGMPIAVALIGCDEVHYFARGDSMMNWICLGLGASVSLLALTSLGYVLLLYARDPEVPVLDLWPRCVNVAIRNIFFTGPLFLVELALGVLAAFLDPALLLMGLPLALVALVRCTAAFGSQRAGLQLSRRALPGASR